MVEIMDGNNLAINDYGYEFIKPSYDITVGDLAKQLHSFHISRFTNMTERVGAGLIRALYATYISYLPNNFFSYKVIEHEDIRGRFVEMIKTPDCGQISFFTAYPGISRGGHYHHTKSEKFLVVRGSALFRFRNISTNEYYELPVNGRISEIVESIPGWAHDITNIGNEEMLVLIWASEILDKNKPDTYSYPLIK
jgi:UDP-2-acetamido-2,6-beta-L-arabino-hexul-4-ose reductase